jgi:hypothetical protein
MRSTPNGLHSIVPSILVSAQGTCYMENGISFYLPSGRYTIVHSVLVLAQMGAVERDLYGRYRIVPRVLDFAGMPKESS